METLESNYSLTCIMNSFQGDEKEPKDAEEVPPRARSYDQHKQSHDNGKYVRRRGPRGLSMAALIPSH